MRLIKRPIYVEQYLEWYKYHMKHNGAKTYRFIETSDDKGFVLTVDYDNEGCYYEVRVTSPDGDSLSEVFKQTFTPLFGMDICDTNQAGMIAERLANELEAKSNK